MLGPITVGLFYRQLVSRVTHNGRAGFAGVGGCFRLALAAFERGRTGGATFSLGYIVKFEHGYYEGYSD